MITKKKILLMPVFGICTLIASQPAFARKCMLDEMQVRRALRMSERRGFQHTITNVSQNHSLGDCDFSPVEGSLDIVIGSASLNFHTTCEVSYFQKQELDPRWTITGLVFGGGGITFIDDTNTTVRFRIPPGSTESRILIGIEFETEERCRHWDRAFTYTSGFSY